MNDFDPIAWCYDPLKQFVFGDRLDTAAAYYLKNIKVGSHVLIVGGGTGRIINALPTDSQTYFLEKSREMIVRAQRYTSRPVTFIHNDLLDFTTHQKFDYVICPFLLDVFDEVTLNEAISKIDALLKDDGILIVTDFTGKRPLQLKMMYFFFSIFVGIQARRLPPIHMLIVDSGFKLSESITFSGGVLFSHCYQKRIKGK